MGQADLTADQDDEDHVDAAMPTYRSYYVYCDETNIHGGTSHFGWGSLWIPTNRSGDIVGSKAELGLGGLMRKYSYDREVKWEKVDSASREFYCALVDWFFSRKWMMFHGLVVPTATVDWSRYEHKAAARVRFLSELLRAKVREYSPPGEQRRFRVRVDPLPIDYDKEHEKIGKITNSVLKAETGFAPIANIKVVDDSKRSAGVQVCDVLLGALVWAWNEPDISSKRGQARLAVARCVAEHMGWEDLRGATIRQAWKFNSWYFLPRGDPRQVMARPVPDEFQNIERWRPRRRWGPPGSTSP